MTAIVNDSQLEERLKAERQANGSNRYDEVWEGIYMMAPMPDIEHQRLVGRLSAALQVVVDNSQQGGDVLPGANVSDRQADWTSNYRVPDIVICLGGGRAINRGTHLQGGPDFVVEIVSDDDRSEEKLPFYASLGVREALLVHWDPWFVDLYRLDDQQLTRVGQSMESAGAVLESEVLPVVFQIAPSDGRPQIKVACRDSNMSWLI